MKTQYHRRQDGQALVEYAMILVLVAIATIIAITVFGSSLQQQYYCVVFSLETAGTGGAIQGFTLVDADADEDVMAMCGQPIVKANMPSNSLSIRADVADVVDSVVIDMTGPINISGQVEDVYPFATFSNSASDYSGQSFPPGEYTITVAAFSGSGGGGSKLGEMSLMFTVQ